MKNSWLTAATFLCLFVAFTSPLSAQTAANLIELIATAERYYDNSEAADKSSLQTALTAAKAANTNNSGQVRIAYTQLDEAVKAYIKVAQPHSGYSFDMTCFMSNPELTSSNAGWSMAPTVSYDEAEIYNQTFDFYQQLEDMPAGRYTLQVTGFYRNSFYYNGIESAANAGCMLYGNEEEEPMLTLYYDTEAALFNRFSNGGYANSMAEAKQTFDLGFYANNEVTFLHYTSDLLRVGIQNRAANNGNWTCFKQFKLYYWGGQEGIDMRKLRIASPTYGSAGAAVPGSSVGQETPVYYSTAAISDNSAYWYFIEIEKGKYAIQSASTLQYITWDGERIEHSKRYLALTDTLCGDSSLWRLNPLHGDRFSIHNIKQPEELFDTRSGSYIVGTYTNAGEPTEIQQYQFYNSRGELISSFNERRFKVGVSEFRLNNKAVAYDSSSELFLFPIPSSMMNGHDFSATIQMDYNEGWGALTIDGDTVANGTHYTFKEVVAEKSYRLRITDTEGKEAEATITFTGLPVVQIMGDFSGTYSPGQIRVNEPTVAEAKLHQARLRWRGATTQYRNKKQYAIKLYDEAGEPTDVSFFGLRSDNNWILDGMSIDVARMRNRVVTDLWNDYGTLPYYAHEEPNLVNGTRGEFVEVFLNISVR